ncbi:MAG: SGNH/GDSL hydrolase family protein [Candidatus Krumholzibacteriota bacterium]|nr:SGNH/GDSL hydrolase family protein [Candidatus Krumholzibacteriota bacterium]
MNSTAYLAGRKRLNCSSSGGRSILWAGALFLSFFLSACAGEESDSPVVPIIPAVGDTIFVDVEPDYAEVRWHLTKSTGAYSHYGCGDEVLTGMSPGEYNLSWIYEYGWVSSSPELETAELVKDSILTFQRTYMAPDPPLPLKILFLGSSYFGYNDMVQTFISFCQRAGKVLALDTRIVGGYRIVDHVNDYNSIYKIKQCEWDYILLQGGAQWLSLPKWHHEVVPYLEAIRDTIYQNCSHTRIIYMMPWAYEDGLTWIPGEIDTWEIMQKNLYKYSLQVSNNLGLGLAPAGWAWYRAITGGYEYNLYLPDKSHPSVYGSYLLACALYISVFKEEVISSAIDPNRYIELQEIAGRTVFDDFNLWNIACPR